MNIKLASGILFQVIIFILRLLKYESFLNNIHFTRLRKYFITYNNKL